MSLIKSISGIRGTIGGSPSSGLNPLNITKFVVAFSQCVKENTKKSNPKIVVGRDARLSGEMVLHSVIGALVGTGCDVIDIGLATTPTTEMAVMGYNADGGIIITASHNPKEWNALKLLNDKGVFFSASQGNRLIEISESDDMQFAEVDNLGTIIKADYLTEHINKIKELDEVDTDAISKANLTVAYDAINSVGAIAVLELLKELGVKTIHPINDTNLGHFAHNPEPLPQNLTEICQRVKDTKSDVGFVVDPDVDRLSIIDEYGECIGEEYTLVSIADYILGENKGCNTVSNLSSTMALKDITAKHGGKYSASAVGEVNVVEKMYETNAIIGGEGNGGVIYPKLHAGRDALLGIALFLSMMAKNNKKVSEIRRSLPDYFMSKQKVTELPPLSNKDILEVIYANVKNDGNISRIDGVKIDLENSWVHIRASNTEPILRIYSEADSQSKADELALRYKNNIVEILSKL